MEYKWYALFVAQGKEFYVKDKLDDLKSDNENLDTVLLPTLKEVSEVRRKKIIRNTTVYPAYIFIHANLGSTNLASYVREISFVIRILGSENHPRPINDQEMDIVRAIAGDNKIRSAFKYKIGDMIEILGGHCKGLSGRVIDIVDINNLKVEIQIFNRAIFTIVKLEDVRIA